MKLLVFAAVVTCAAVAAAQAKTECPQPQPSQAEEFLTFDPQSVDAAAIDEAHSAGKRAICQVQPSSLDLVQLCRDKGFDAITFDPMAETDRLRKQAERLKLPVVDSAGRRTTNGS